jgi:hypothetical protein
LHASLCYFLPPTLLRLLHAGCCIILCHRCCGTVLLPNRRKDGRLGACLPGTELLPVLEAMKLVTGVDLETEVELSPIAKAEEAAVFSPYSSPSTALLLQRRVVSWYGCLSSI